MGSVNISYPILVSTSNRSLSNYLKTAELSSASSFKEALTSGSISSHTSISTYRSSQYNVSESSFSGLKTYLSSRDSIYVGKVYFGSVGVYIAKKHENYGKVKCSRHKHAIHLSREFKTRSSNSINQNLLDIGSNELAILSYIVH